MAVAKLGVVEGVIDIALGIRLDYGQGLEALAQYCQFLRMDTNLARLCAEHIALDADEVAQVEEFLEERISPLPAPPLGECFILAALSLRAISRRRTFSGIVALPQRGSGEGAGCRQVQAVPRQIDLYSSLAVLQLSEGCLAHDALRHDAACDADVAAVLWCRSLADVVSFIILAYDGQVNEAFLYLRAESVCGVLSSGIRVDAQVAQLLQVISADNLLFAQFKYVQCVHLFNFLRFTLLCLFCLCHRFAACVPEINDFNYIVVNLIDDFVEAVHYDASIQHRCVCKVRLCRPEIGIPFQ